MARDRGAGARIETMIGRQLVARGVTDERVLAAMRAVRRERFVPVDLAAQAYDDNPLPIGHGVTISQPYIVALMTEALAVTPTDRVLEVGTGSGYGAAVLAELAGSVVTIESIGALVAPARERLAGYGDRVEVVHGDGSLGHPPGAPYDAISVTAAADDVPPPLLEQLAVGGRLVMPVGRGVEDLVRVVRTQRGFERDVLTRVRFVPLTGEFGIHREPPGHLTD